ncbi:MAG: hypothetical protein PUH21_08720 [Prevotellaceae bacterium]|nr:hypothetical protein [Prevotellaceae bacterium]
MGDADSHSAYGDAQMAETALESLKAGNNGQENRGTTLISTAR